MVKKYIILTLADGGENNEIAGYRKYSTIRKNATSHNPSYYQNNLKKLNPDDQRIKDNGEWALSLDSVNTGLFIVRENVAGAGFQLDKVERTILIRKVIKKYCNLEGNTGESEVCVIAHDVVDESELSDCQVMTYKTGGDFNTSPEWGVVCYIIDDCLLNGQFPVFEDLKKKIENCAIPKKIRRKIHELELLIAPLKIESCAEETTVKNKAINESLENILNPAI